MGMCIVFTRPGLNCCLLWLLFVASAGEGAIYRWVDQQGRVHYGSQAPTDQAEQLDIDESEAPPPAPDMQLLDRERGRQRDRLLEHYRDQREQKRRAADKQAEEDQRRQQNCAKAQRRLVRYQRSSAIYETMEDGSRRFLSQQEYDAELERMRQAVQQWCDE